MRAPRRPPGAVIAATAERQKRRAEAKTPRRGKNAALPPTTSPPRPRPLLRCRCLEEATSKKKKMTRTRFLARARYLSPAAADPREQGDEAGLVDEVGEVLDVEVVEAALLLLLLLLLLLRLRLRSRGGGAAAAAVVVVVVASRAAKRGHFFVFCFYSDNTGGVTATCFEEGEGRRRGALLVGEG